VEDEMSTETLTELDEFQRYLERLRSHGEGHMSLDECVTEFRLYQEELRRCREEIRPALESSLRGESTPWDPEEMKQRIRERYEASQRD
jgi:hypothetical protein